MAGSISWAKKGRTDNTFSGYLLQQGNSQLSRKTEI